MMLLIRDDDEEVAKPKPERLKKILRGAFNFFTARSLAADAVRADIRNAILNKGELSPKDLETLASRLMGGHFISILILASGATVSGALAVVLAPQPHAALYSLTSSGIYFSLFSSLIYGTAHCLAGMSVMLNTGGILDIEKEVQKKLNKDMTRLLQYEP